MLQLPAMGCLLAFAFGNHYWPLSCCYLSSSGQSASWLVHPYHQVLLHCRGCRQTHCVPWLVLWMHAWHRCLNTVISVLCTHVMDAVNMAIGYTLLRLCAAYEAALLRQAGALS
jgi:hypothetical protein